jgi:hypothetical protein
VLLTAGLAACSGGPAGLAARDPLERLRLRATPVPDEPDHAAHDLAVAALAGDAGDTQAQQKRLEAVERLHQLAGAPRSGLPAYGQHLTDATQSDAIAYRRASHELLQRGDAPPALRRKLELEIADDPLQLADDRIRDSRRARMARAVNALTQALGRSLSMAALAPLRLAQAAIGIAVAEHVDDPISVQERQALAHWKQYVETHPGSPETAKLLARIEALQQSWFAMKRERSVRAARQALDGGQDELALVLASKALLYAAEDREAAKLRDEAEARVFARRAARARSLEAAPLDPGERGDPLVGALARALLDPQGDVIGAARALLAEGGPQGSYADEARFAEALAAGERGDESRMWELLDKVAGEDLDDRNMARHARQLVTSPDTHPYAAFQRSRIDRVERQAGFILFGPLAGGARDRDLPRALEWLLEGPALVGTLGGIPARLAQSATVGAAPARAPALHARRYLERFPDGEHAADLRRWLVDYYVDAGNPFHAYSIARSGAGVDDERRTELEHAATRQMLESARKQPRRDLRVAMLSQIAEQHPDTESGREAAALAHEELATATAQSIRISRGFLIENPVVAGPSGVGLRPVLLDENPHNGELHPDGVRLIGGRVLEFSLLAASGDDDDPPETLRREVSEERLARLIALLEETAARNALIDPDNDLAPDARRDHFFERAKLGVADEAGIRASASSSYAFIGMREKYGMVRSRESILPFELVVQGSFPDLGLGAFPRLRMPKTTPDAVLFQ